MKKYIIVIAVVICNFTNTTAQNRGEDNLGSWFMFFSTNRISEKMSIHAEAQYRTYEFGSNFNQLLLRSGLTYNISDNATVTLGYANITTDDTFTEPDGEENVNENRIYQEFVLGNSLGKLKFSHRYRLEQRFIAPPQGENTTEHRARYFLRVTYPLNDTWFLTAYNEIFINLQNDFFGQNRLFGALGYNVNKDVSLQMGYLKNDFAVDTFDRFQLAMFIKTDFRKKK